MTWEQEKAYCAKRASELKTEMEAAIAASDKERFTKAFETAQRYMKKKELKSLFVAMVRKGA